jgi:hypothetical protein
MRAASPLQSIVVFSSSAPQNGFLQAARDKSSAANSGSGSLTGAIKVISSVLYGPIPYASKQGIFAALQGIKSGEQGNSRPDQGTSRWSATWRFAGGDNSDRSDRSRTLPRKRTKEVADADLRARGRLCPSESLLHARRRTRRRKRSAFRALHRAHPRRRRIPFPPPAKGEPDSQTLPFARNTYFLRYCFYGTTTTRINFV